MLERFIQNKKLDAAKLSAKKLLSARGEANAQSMAVKLIDHYDHLDKRSQIDFFHFLSSQFNPDPSLVVDAANRYNTERNEASLIHLFQTVEPPRQELLRRVNRAPAGTATILKMRQTLLSYLQPFGPPTRTCTICSVPGSTRVFWSCTRSPGTLLRNCSKKSLPMNQCTPSMAGTIYAAVCNRTAVVLLFFIPNCPANR